VSARYTSSISRSARTRLAELLTNRFYWGDLLTFEEVRGEDGRARKVQGGWTPGKHESLPGFDEALWKRIQAMREQRRRRVGTTSRARTYSLTGIVSCDVCGSRIGITRDALDKPRLGCRTRKQGGTCDNRLTFLSVYEDQVGAYLDAFRIPADYQEQLLAAMRAMGEQQADPEAERRQLQARLERSKKLYEWGDKPEAEYLAERAELLDRLRALAVDPSPGADLEALAAVLRDVKLAWNVADQEEPNQLARTLFDDLRVLGHQIVAVKPRDAFAPFFRLNYQAWKTENPPVGIQEGSRSGQERKRRGCVAHFRPDGIVRIELLDLRPERRARAGEGRYAAPRATIPAELWPGLCEQARAIGLRKTAHLYGVSHEAIRQIVLCRVQRVSLLRDRAGCSG
jgi:hypothetical protein